MADVQRVAGKGKKRFYKKKRFYGKGNSLAKKVAKLTKMVKSTAKAVEWKRQNFWISAAANTPQASPPVFENVQQQIVLDDSGWVICPTDWLFSISNYDQSNSSANGNNMLTGDGVVGKKVRLRYLQFGLTIESFGEYNSETDQRFPLFPVRIIVVRSKGGSGIYPAGLSGPGLPLAQREGKWSNALSASQALFGKKAGGFSGGNMIPVLQPTTSALDSDFGGKSKQFNVLLDEIVNPNTPMTGGAISTNGQFSKIYKLSLDHAVAFENDLTGASGWPSYYGGQLNTYDDGCLQIILINDFNTGVVVPEGYNNQQVSVSGYLSYQDA